MTFDNLQPVPGCLRGLRGAIARRNEIELLMMISEALPVVGPLELAVCDKV